MTSMNLSYVPLLYSLINKPLYGLLKLFVRSPHMRKNKTFAVIFSSSNPSVPPPLSRGEKTKQAKDAPSPLRRHRKSRRHRSCRRRTSSPSPSSQPQQGQPSPPPSSCRHRRCRHCRHRCRHCCHRHSTPRRRRPSWRGRPWPWAFPDFMFCNVHSSSWCCEGWFRYSGVSQVTCSGLNDLHLGS